MIRSLFQEGPDPRKAIKQGTFSKIHMNQFHKVPDQKLLKKIYNTLPLKGTFHTIANSYGKLSFRTRNWKTAKLWATEETPQTPGNMEQIILK